MACILIPSLQLQMRIIVRPYSEFGPESKQLLRRLDYPRGVSLETLLQDHTMYTRERNLSEISPRSALLHTDTSASQVLPHFTSPHCNAFVNFHLRHAAFEKAFCRFRERLSIAFSLHFFQRVLICFERKH